MIHNSDNDWRKQNQSTYLKGVKLAEQDYSPYRPGWDHDHCEFCGAKFSMTAGDLKKGFATPDKYHWVCESYYRDFKEEFGW